MNKYFNEFAWDSYQNLQTQYLKLYEENKRLKNNILQLIKDVDEYDFNFWGYRDFKEILKNSLNELLVEGGDSDV